ncbi:hypothetical protein GCM10010116_22240 [Microbispora rosea subsp. aerata]|nr:ATP-binding protein [Microbispora rosea]GGO11054.1 hypothetical protein GCM10010116_22240 [Microbispora rosea subsp. aerata]GIH53593.1 hypothetical protein Mro02_05070 [Microbispora rosea subsp. aerata]GLJ86276.1 hypothetical protein GCM10017588_50110 [Microbispora rosea subsp. aerata]
MLISPFPSQEGRESAFKVFGSAATAPRRARAFVRCQLREWELARLADTAELVVSELVTNAVRATEAVVSPPVASSMFPVALRTVALRVSVMPGRHGLVIEVWDVSDREPVAPGAAEGSAGNGPTPGTRDDGADELGESGRGLALVAGLASKWGHYAAPDRGKIVWCELAIVPAEGAAGAGSPWGGGSEAPAADRREPVVAVADAPVGVPASGGLPRRARRHPVAAWTDGPDEATLLRVLEGLRALDVSGPKRR